MGTKRDILAILSDQRIYDTTGIKYNLISRDKTYSYISLNEVAILLRRMQSHGDIIIITKPRADRHGNPLPGRRLIECQITQLGLNKVKYLYKKGLIRKKMITALR